jgi:hypothetical protein
MRVSVCLEKKWQTDVVLLSDGSFSRSLHQYSLVVVTVVVVYLFFLLNGHTRIPSRLTLILSLSLTHRYARATREKDSIRFSHLFSSLFRLSPSPPPSSSSPQRAITLTYLLLLDSLPFFFSLSLSLPLTSQAFRDRRTAQIIRSLLARVLLHISSLFVLLRCVRERRNFADVIDRAKEFTKVDCF